MNTTLYFPIGFNSILTLIGARIDMNQIAAQEVHLTTINLTTTSQIAATGTLAYLAIGI